MVATLAKGPRTLLKGLSLGMVALEWGTGCIGMVSTGF